MSAHDDMTCAEAIRQLDDYLDREIDPAALETINRHLEHCPPCAEEFRFEASVIQGIRRKLAEVAIPDDLRQRVLQRLERIDPT